MMTFEYALNALDVHKSLAFLPTDVLPELYKDSVTSERDGKASRVDQVVRLCREAVDTDQPQMPLIVNDEAAAVSSRNVPKHLSA